jgi:N-acetylglucosaminyldiphosphoundecaprenol N-acetyl-beta-D-mannosaminyltransferase
MTVKICEYQLFNNNLESILSKDKKIVVNTINAHSYIVAKSDKVFKKALISSDILLPDGEGIVLMAKKTEEAKN